MYSNYFIILSCFISREYGSGLPTSLSSLLRKNAHDSVTNNAQATNLNPLHIATRKEIYGHSLDELGRLSHHQTVHSSRAHYLEWGAVNFDDLVMKRLHNPQQATPHHFRSNSGSQHASPSSSVSSIGSYMMISQTFSLSHLQSSTSLDRTGNSVSSCGDTHAAINKAHWSDDSMTTNGTEGQLDKKDRNLLQKGKSRDSSEEKSRNLASIKQFMLEHDKHTFSRSPKAKNLDSNSVHNVMKSSLENGIMNSLSGSYR